jgi:hypothetical protein
MGRRREYDEGYEDARREMMDRETSSRRGSDGAFTAAVFIKYAAIVIVVLISALTSKPPLPNPGQHYRQSRARRADEHHRKREPVPVQTVSVSFGDKLKC